MVTVEGGVSGLPVLGRIGEIQAGWATGQAIKPTGTSPKSIDATLSERGNRYGAFTGHARITQNIKRAMTDSPNWAKLSDPQKEALEMTAHKIGRILNGDPDYHDSWHDINGYIKLVADDLLGVSK